MRAGSLVFASSSGRAVEESGLPAASTVEEQLEQALLGIEASLAELGSSLRHAVSVRVLAVDLSEREAVARVLQKRLGGAEPALSVAEALSLGEPWRIVEVAVVAVANTAQGGR